ncbi:MAG TPA: hypothetical protein EYP07_16120, partial [Kiloniellaceae bacterium]|nr:hypothetical protein [Kiloniellaceae bacterium]
MSDGRTISAFLDSETAFRYCAFMTDNPTSPDRQHRLPAQGAAGRWLNPWSSGAIAIALLVIAPIAAVVWIAFHPAENIWPHLMATTLPRYVANTLILMVSVGTLAACAGTG